ncbi:MAG TPA: TlpA disulfide reductase family protein, partial [Flavobacteriales bacterium]|nr:TlpA disulfide reductase family protein [Flavobacteriales bacterium]
MKTSSIFQALACIILVSCGNIGSNSRTVELNVEGAGNRTAVFDKFDNNVPVRVDTVVLDANGKGKLEIPKLPLDFYRITIDGEQLVLALDSAESLSIDSKLGDLNMPSRIEGSLHATALHDFFKSAKTFETETNTLKEALNMQPPDASTMARYNQLNAEFYERTKTFTQENSGSPVAITSVTRLDINKEMDLFKKVRDDLRKVMPKSSVFTQFRDQVASFETQQTQLKMQQEAEERKNSMLPFGSVAPEIRQQTPDGGTFALSDLRGQYVLIDFWASWCRPCRYENPNVKRIYERFHKKGFEIL